MDKTISAVWLQNSRLSTLAFDLLLPDNCCFLFESQQIHFTFFFLVFFSPTNWNIPQWLILASLKHNSNATSRCKQASNSMQVSNKQHTAWNLIRIQSQVGLPTNGRIICGFGKQRITNLKNWQQIPMPEFPIKFWYLVFYPTHKFP